MADSVQQVIADRIADAIEASLFKLTFEPRDAYYILALTRVCPSDHSSVTAVSLKGEIKVEWLLDVVQLLSKSVVDSLIST